MLKLREHMKKRPPLATTEKVQQFVRARGRPDYGFEPTDTPRPDRSVSKNIELGFAALDGQKGPAYDRIVLNTGIVDHLLGCDGAEDASVAMDRAREAIDSGKALKKLLNYIKMSHKIK